MKDRPSVFIRLMAYEGDNLFDLREEFDIAELGGVVPSVGDFIVDPGVLSGLDRSDTKNRRIFEVLSRYFMPTSRTDFVYIAIVVKARPAYPSEEAVACRT